MKNHRYLDSSREFFSVVSNRARETRTKVAKIAGNALAIHSERPEKMDRIAAVYEPALHIMRDDWVTLHSFIKPATDAHTLAMPHALVRFALDQIGLLPGLEDASVVVLLTSQLMYFLNSTSDVPNGQRGILPSKMGFVELPYSEGSSFFSNLVLFHELGHYVFGRCKDAKRGPFANLANAMERSLGSQAELAGLKKTERRQCRT
jgi:hypothetical protein